MEFKNLLELVGDEPVFESALLLAGKVNPNYERLQLTRWTKGGRVYQLRRGLYMLTPPYQKTRPHPFLVANRLQRASYVSGRSALAFYGLIPDTVQATTSVTAGRGERLGTPLGVFEFRHIKSELMCGYHMVPLVNEQQALIATPEKALLDLVYLQPGGDTPEYLHELRMQNLERLDLDELQRLVETFNTPKLDRAYKVIADLARAEIQEYETLSITVG
jgi:predicted transcriptional regulator of viral defense system